VTRLGELIAERIREGGPISFAEYMDISLYHPEHGYYARAAQRTGRAGDFFTSVDVGPVFGELLAKQFAEMWRLVPHPSFDLVEAGAGNGRLSRDILDAAERHHPDFLEAVRLSLVEKSAAARVAQVETLGRHRHRLVYSDAVLPAEVTGVIFANELLDALPTHAVAMTGAGLREVFIDLRDGRFVECFHDLSSRRLAEYLARAGASLVEGWRAEVNLAAEEWIGEAGRALTTGFLIVIDYGHDESELYGSSHAGGTLAMFKQHTADVDLQEPGTHDITAHVDLSAVRRAAEHSGLESIGQLDQTYFLMGLGLEEIMNSPPGFDRAALGRRLALKTLLMPGGLGSTHKVMIFGKGVGTPALRGCSYRTRIT
jgi:SAM-dependent MidA family methyltransferase